MAQLFKPAKSCKRVCFQEGAGVYLHDSQNAPENNKKPAGRGIGRHALRASLCSLFADIHPDFTAVAKDDCELRAGVNNHAPSAQKKIFAPIINLFALRGTGLLRRVMGVEVMRLDEFAPKTIQEVVLTYSDMLIRIAYQHTGSLSDAEDIAQEAFVRLLRMPLFSQEEHQKAWLIRVTVNLCKDLKKSFWHRKTVPLSETMRTEEPADLSLFDELRRLPGQYRDTLYLYYYEGYSVPQIAKLLDTPENTVSSWLTRGRKKLKTLLEEV
jgi:RNA polymerase sigma-70 factor (ECF subfamily)